MQHVRAVAGRRLGVERGPLTNAEPVLLVDDHDRQARELNRLLDQRVGPDQQRQLAAVELAEQVGAAARGGRAGQQPDRNCLAGHQRLDRGEVLLGQRLRRRHQGALVAVLDGTQQRV